MPWRKRPKFDAYALLEDGQWFGVVQRFTPDGAPEEQLVLREHPQGSATEALEFARAHAAKKVDGG